MACAGRHGAAPRTTSETPRGVRGSPPHAARVFVRGAAVQRPNGNSTPAMICAPEFFTLPPKGSSDTSTSPNS